MPYGARKPKKKTAEREHNLADNVVAAITEAAFLAAAADGEVTDAERDIVASLIVELFDGNITVRNVRSLIQEFADALENEGYDARVDITVENLPDASSQVDALYAVSGVILSDDEYDPDSEGAFYDTLAEKLGFDEELAAEIWNNQVERYGWA